MQRTLVCALPHRRRTALATLLSLFALARQRRALARLDSHRLSDMGISQSDATAEANRPVWDVPANWRG